MAKTLTIDSIRRMQEGRKARRTALETAPKPRTALQGTIGPIAARLKQMPLSYRATYERAMSGKSAKSGIKSFCQECLGWENASDGIRTCKAVACPLHPYRPHR